VGILLLFEVTPPVIIHVSFGCESLPANLANEGLFLGVDADVSFEIRPL
jgi:hypothetical protein